MGIQHAVILFPRFEVPDAIESIRHRFDPLASVLQAHVTLVFPFCAELTDESLCEHVVAATVGVSPFDIGLTDPTAEDDGYVLLKVTDGRDAVVALHDCLYTGQLAAHLASEHAYDPHITVGRRASRDDATDAAREASLGLVWPLRARVDTIAVFCLDGHSGHVMFTTPLLPRAELASRHAAL